MKSLYPDHDGYLDVYHQYGLTGKTVSLLTASISKKKSGIVSAKPNPALLSVRPQPLPRQRLIQLEKAWQKKVKVGMGTDIGAGTTFNMLQTLNEAYKVLQLQGYRLSAYEAFYLATLGGAKSLGLDDLIGNFYLAKRLISW